METFVRNDRFVSFGNGMTNAISPEIWRDLSENGDESPEIWHLSTAFVQVTNLSWTKRFGRRTGEIWLTDVRDLSRTSRDLAFVTFVM